MILEDTDLETGEIIDQKPYETDEHRAIKNEVAKQIAYVNRTLKDEEGQIAKLDGNTLSLVLMELTAYYQYLYNWISNQRLYVSDLKSAYEIKFAKEYVRLKDQGKTNETSRMMCKLHCQEDDKEINRQKHGLDVVITWEKSIARYIDAVRSQMAWIKFERGSGG